MITIRFKYVWGLIHNYITFEILRFIITQDYKENTPPANDVNKWENMLILTTLQNNKSTDKAHTRVRNIKN